MRFLADQAMGNGISNYSLRKIRRYTICLLLFALAAVVHGQTDLEVIIDQYSYTFCQGDSVEVEVMVEGPGATIFVNFEVNGEPLISKNEDLVTIRRWFNTPGSLLITAYGTELPTLTVIDTSILITVEIFPPPRVNFTGSGINCNSQDYDTLTAHFEGEPPFSLFWSVNGNPDSLIDYDLYDYNFPYDGSFEMVLDSISDGNCGTALSDTITYNLIDLVSLSIQGDSAACKDQPIVYTTEATDLYTRWYIPEGAEYSEGNDEGIPYIDVRWTEPGDHEVRLKLVDLESGCETYWTVKPITVYDRPVIEEIIDTTICFEEQYPLILSISTDPGDVIHWIELDQDGSEVELTEEGTYSYIHTNSYNCSDTGLVVLANNCIPDIHIPEAFTPNGDNLNDQLLIFGLFTEIDLKIYSPSGILLYETTDPEMPWDGTYDGREMPPGSYYWHIRYSGRDEITRTKTGIVTLIR